MSELPKVSVPVEDRLLIHLLEQDHQADRFLVTAAVTRPGIAESCALHAPNVSRSMRTLVRDGLVDEHMRSVRGDARRQKTWQLSESGRDAASDCVSRSRGLKVLIRDGDGRLLEVNAGEAGERLEAELTLLQILMHAQHEGVLTYGDIRFGLIHRRDEGKLPPPGRIVLLKGVHSTYHTSPPQTRRIHGRRKELTELGNWVDSTSACMVVTGIAGIGKSALCANWLSSRHEGGIIWYPCQPWDTELGIATSLLHGLGVREDSDEHRLMDTLPLAPGDGIEIDSLRRRLVTLLSAAEGEIPLVVLDDVHNLPESAEDLLGALLQVAGSTPLRLLMISRTSLGFYDRRDVHTRDKVRELALQGLSIEEVGQWIESFEADDPPAADLVHSRTGGHPLAVELLEMYGQTVHGDWLRFLDEEILDVLPDDEHELLATLAVAKRPVPWEDLADGCGYDGRPPPHLIEHGLLLELAEGMWLHEALRERLLREVGEKRERRRARLSDE